MAVTVEQTIPFDTGALDLANPRRWTKLLPLIRPSVKLARQTSTGHSILVDEARLSSPYVRVAAIGNLGNFSSKLLSDGHITAIATETKGEAPLRAEIVAEAIGETGPGVVIVRAGKKREVQWWEME